ncbi:hypothetical protein K5549_020910, partial [Capra hircus]|uniref:Uncharacterized protein n=1 Tax=Capra hircus TaxID=9925 RepID=A0A8C2XXC2_CAPHI
RPVRPVKTSESEEEDGEEAPQEECIEGEGTIPSNPSKEALSKAGYNAFRNGVPFSIVPKKIPKKIITPSESDDSEGGRRKRGPKHR